MQKVIHRRRFIGASFTLTLAGLVSCAAPPPAAKPAATVASATQAQSVDSGELVIYTARSESLFKPVIEAFNKVYPNIKVTMLSGTNGALAAKIFEEANNPKADVLVNTDTLTMADMGAKGAFAPNNSTVVAAISESYRAADSGWVALTLRPRVIMYNTNLVKPEELPKSVLDLTDPKWKDQVGAADSTNGAMMANLVALRKYVGAEKTEAFVKGLVANGAKFFSGHTDVRKAVGAGELKLGFVNHYYYHLSKAEGAPVGIVYPDQDSFGLVVNTTNAGIIKGSQHIALAQRFIDFMLSPDGQKIYAEKNFEYPIIKDVPLAPGVDPLDKFKVADITLKAMFDDVGPTKTMAEAAGLP